MSLYQSASKFRIFNTEILKMNITNFLQLLCQRGGRFKALWRHVKGGGSEVLWQPVTKGGGWVKIHWKTRDVVFERSLTDLQPTFGERVPRQLHTLQLICVLLASAMLCKAIRRSSIEVDTNYNNQEPLYKYGQRGSATLIRSSIQLKAWTICSNFRTTRRKFGMSNLWLQRHLYLNERSGTDFTLRLFMGGGGENQQVWTSTAKNFNV